MTPQNEDKPGLVKAEAPAAIAEPKCEPTIEVVDAQEILLQRVLQHALNVLVAFRIRATDRTVYLLKDMTAEDLETAVSVAELTKLAIEHKCEGIDLLTKPPVEILTETAIRGMNDKVLGAAGGVFSHPDDSAAGNSSTR